MPRRGAVCRHGMGPWSGVLCLRGLWLSEYERRHNDKIRTCTDSSAISGCDNVVGLTRCSIEGVDNQDAVPAFHPYRYAGLAAILGKQLNLALQVPGNIPGTFGQQAQGS